MNPDSPKSTLNKTLAQLLTDGSQASQFVDESGVAYGVKQIDGKPRVSAMPYTYDIAEGNIADHVALYKFGSNPDVGTTEETIWQQGGLYDWAGVDAAPGTVTISSSSTDDVNTTGTGVWTATIYGLNTDGQPANETLALDGQTGVPSTLNYSRINRIICNTAGTGRKNAGVIYVGTGAIGSGVPAVIWSTVAIGRNQTLQSIWTVPMGFTFYMTSFNCSTNSNKGTIVNMYFRPPGELFQIKANGYLFGNHLIHKYEFPLPIASMTDIDCRAIGTAVGGAVQFSFEGWYE